MVEFSVKPDLQKNWNEFFDVISAFHEDQVVCVFSGVFDVC